MLPVSSGNIPDLKRRGPEYYQDILVTFRTSNIDLVDPRRPRSGILPGETGNIPDLMIGNIPDLVNGGVSDLIPFYKTYIKRIYSMYSSAILATKNSSQYEVLVP